MSKSKTAEDVSALVAELSDDELLKKFRLNMMHAGDDFSLAPYGDEEELAAKQLQEEILRRMAAADALTAQLIQQGREEGLREAAEIARTVQFKDGCLVAQGRETIVSAIAALRTTDEKGEG